jgi:RNA polymerase sigma-70 factor (ECF subfamily)
VQDRDLRARFRQGDPDAVREVYRSHGRLVYAVAYRVLADRGLAEEATQQTFVKAWRAAQSFDEGRELGPWLAAIARRMAIDVYRREAVRSADPIESVPAGDPAVVTTPAEAEAIYDVWEVREAVAQLPDDEQQVIRLQHLDGFTHTQIAQRLGVALGTVKSRSFRAHKRLAGLLGHLRE